MENNPELQLAWQFIENTGTHLFLTGKAGTGKTTFLRELKERTPKRMIVLAPTGIAAINAGGVTIHSFFQLPFAPHVPDTTFNSAQTLYRFSKEKRNIIRSMDLLVIDEISMVRADLLDALDTALRRYRDRTKPFGGVQLLMIGDLQQLAPVVKDDEWNMLKNYYDTPYFFASRALRQTTYMTIELKKVYRQSDGTFLSLLNKIRENQADEGTLAALNSRYFPGFQPRREEGYIRLTTHNYRAQQVNDRELTLLSGQAYSFRAEVTGTFPEYAYPADDVLTVKAGAQIMFIKNDASGGRYYNGMIGEVVTVNATGMFVRGKSDQHDFQLTMEEWTNSKYVLDDVTKEITEEVEGTFRQYPIRLAWAITIHKSQGLTFEHAIIDARNSFAHGQTYVALSRCKTLEGMVLESPLRSEAIISDLIIDKFTKEAGQNAPDEARLHDLQRAYFFDLLKELFDFFAVEQAFKLLLRLMDEHLYRLYPKVLREYKATRAQLKEKITDVAQRFQLQYTRMLNEMGDYTNDPALQQRIHSAADYFYREILLLRELVENTHLPTDNKELKKQIKERMEAFEDALGIKASVLEFMRVHEFTVTNYLNCKAKAVLSMESDTVTPKAKKEKKDKNTTGRVKVEVPSDILHPKLYRQLTEWRSAKAREIGQPAYVIIQQKALLGMVNLLPDTAGALETVPYFGAKGVEKYGLEILTIIRKFMKNNELERPEIKEVIVPKKTAEEVKDTRVLSYNMFCKGMSIEEIAKARELVTGTIAGHLEQYVRSGEIKIEQVVAADKLKKIIQYLKENGNSQGMIQVKIALGDDVSYADIKLAMASL